MHLTKLLNEVRINPVGGSHTEERMLGGLASGRYLYGCEPCALSEVILEETHHLKVSAMALYHRSGDIPFPTRQSDAHACSSSCSTVAPEVKVHVFTFLTERVQANVDKILYLAKLNPEASSRTI